MMIRNSFLPKDFLRLIAAPALFAGVFFLLSAQAPAQISKVGEVVLAQNESARGVSFEWPYAYVSLFNDGVQWVVDLTNPFSPTPVTSFNPAFGDQWNENFVQKGRLVCGHRFGGLNLWDVTGVPFQLDTANTNYHFDGLDILTAASQTLLFYSEDNASNGPGGLRVYDITNNLLTNIGNSVVGNNQRDGGIPGAGASPSPDHNGSSSASPAEATALSGRPSRSASRSQCSRGRLSRTAPIRRAASAPRSAGS